MQGFGVQPSWPTKPLILRIPIDHILVSKNIVTARRWIGPETGSDHLPVFADLVLQH